jgi:hypothetical protein
VPAAISGLQRLPQTQEVVLDITALCECAVAAYSVLLAERIAGTLPVPHVHCIQNTM